MAQQAVPMQQRQQRRHGGGLHGEVELDFRAARRRRHVGQAHAFRQRGAQRLSHQRHQHREAVVDVGFGVAALAQRLHDDIGLAVGRGIARLPVAPCSEVRVLQRGVHHHAKAAAGEARIGLHQRRDGRIGQYVGIGRGRFVFAAGISLGGGSQRIGAFGMRELGEAVDPPVGGDAAACGAGRRDDGRTVLRQARRRRLGRSFDDAHIGLRTQAGDAGKQWRKAAPVEILHIARRDPQRMRRAGQADIEQPRILGDGIAPGRLTGRFPCGILLVDLPLQHAAAIVVVHDAVTAGVGTVGAQPGERQVDQRILQALALVQGDDLHTQRIAFQPQQLRFVAGIGTGDAHLQPVEQTLQAQRAGGGLLQVLAQLQVVRQPPLAVQQAEQPRGLFGAQFGHQCERAAALPAFAPVQQLRLVVALRIASVFQGGDGGGVLAEQHRGQCRTQPAAVGGMQQGEQQGAQLAGLGGLEQALPARSDRRHAGARQGLLHTRGVLVVAHQHGDVAGLHAPTPDQGAIPAGRGEDGMDVRHAGGDGGFPRGVGVEGSTVAAQQPQRQCRCGRAIAQVMVVALRTPRLDRLEVDAGMREGLLPRRRRAGVQRLHRAQHGRSRAEVVGQRIGVDGGGMVLGGQVRGDIAAPEAVDGLLRISDQEQGGHVADRTDGVGIAEHAGEDLPLALVRVLELVDQCDPVLRAQPGHQRQRVRTASQGVGDAVDQVVVGLHAARALEQLQALARFVAQAVEQRGTPGELHLLPGVVGFAPVAQGVEQRRYRHARLLPFLAVAQQGVRQQLLQVRLVGARPIGEDGTGLQFVERLVEARSARAAAIEHLGVERRRDHGARLRQVQADRLDQMRGTSRTRRVDGDLPFLIPFRRRHRIQRQWLAQCGQVFGQGVGILPQADEGVGGLRIGGMHAPEVGGDLGIQVARVAEQFDGGQALPRFQRMFAQHAGAEAVDGEDGGEVGFLHRGAQAARQLRRRLGAAGEMAIQDEARQRDLMVLVVPHRHADHVRGQRQPLPDALAQLLGGGFGIGHRQHLAHAQPLFDDQAGEQRRQRVGLAGTRTGLDQLHAVQGARQVRLLRQVGGAHAAPPSCRIRPWRSRS